MISISVLIGKILDAICSYILCFKIFSFKEAIKCPIHISYKTKVTIAKGAKVLIKKPLKRNMVQIGFVGAKYIHHNDPILYLGKNSRLRIGHNCIFGPGSVIWVEDGASLNIGDNFYCNNNCVFRSSKNISIGNNVLFGWNVVLNTTDGHILSCNNEESELEGDIVLGNHIWIAANVVVAKNIKIANECVVAQHSLVNKSFNLSNCLIGGIPAKELKYNIVRKD